ncbi:MAG: hypothetical protein ABL860_09265 [Candidatus Nitrotoga sp.]
MNKIALLLAVLFLAVSTVVGAETKPVMDNRSIDLRYCLDLPTVHLIAKCSGEVSAGKKGTPFSQEEVARIIAEENAKRPDQMSESPALSVPISDIPQKVLQSEER